MIGIQHISHPCAQDVHGRPAMPVGLAVMPWCCDGPSDLVGGRDLQPCPGAHAVIVNPWTYIHAAVKVVNRALADVGMAVTTTTFAWLAPWAVQEDPVTHGQVPRVALDHVSMELISAMVDMGFMKQKAMDHYIDVHDYVHGPTQPIPMNV